MHADEYDADSASTDRLLLSGSSISNVSAVGDESSTLT